MVCRRRARPCRTIIFPLRQQRACPVAKTKGKEKKNLAKWRYLEVAATAPTHARTRRGFARRVTDRLRRRRPRLHVSPLLPLPPYAPSGARVSQSRADTRGGLWFRHGTVPVAAGHFVNSVLIGNYALSKMSNNSTHAHAHEEAGDVVTAKVVAMVTLGLTSLVMGTTPILLARCFGWSGKDGTMVISDRARAFVNALLSFGGGALLSTTFLHLMHEVGEGVDNLQATGDLPDTPFPLPQFIMCCGFFTIYLVEELVHLSVHNQRGHVTHADGSDISEDNKHTSHSHLIVPNNPNDKLFNSIRGFLIVLALSIHELFEGLAVGLETTAGETWYMLGAVAAHKLVIAFCVSVELVSTHVVTWLALVYVATFSLVTPIGIGTGLLLTEGAEGGVPNTVLQGLATGTLLYVVFFEILQRQRQLGGSSRFSGLQQLFAVLVGFCVMLLLLSTVGHEHEHDH